MHSGTVNAKSFTMFSLNQGLLARCVEAVKEGDALARKTGQIQSFEVFRNGFRMNLVIGRIMVVPPSVCESREDFPVSLLYGALVREIRPEDLSDLMCAKIGDSEFDEYDTADMQEIKEKLFQVPGSKKYASLVLFLPSWTSPREYVMFKYTKDDLALANALRHLVFAAYYDPRLSSAFDHIMQDTDTVDHGTELDVTNITPKLNYPGVAEGAINEYPKLESADEAEASQDRPTGPGSKKKKKASGPKFKMVLAADAAQAIHEDELASGEVDVISAVTEAAEAAILNKRETVSDAAADDNAAKHASDEGLQHRPDYGKCAYSQVPCPFCRHSEPTTDDIDSHIERAHKNKRGSKVAQNGHKVMDSCQGSIGESHKKCPGVVDGIHCDCNCHEKAEQEGIIGSKQADAHDEGVQKNIDAIKAKGHPCPICRKQTDAKGPCPSCLMQVVTSSDKTAGDAKGLGQMKVKMKLNLDELPEDAQAKVVDGATSAAKNMGDAAKTASHTFCECADPGCPRHKGSNHCENPAMALMYRVDMEDAEGTAMCEDCAVDAMDSGVFMMNEISEHEAIPQMASKVAAPATMEQESAPVTEAPAYKPKLYEPQARQPLVAELAALKVGYKATIVGYAVTRTLYNRWSVTNPAGMAREFGSAKEAADFLQFMGKGKGQAVASKTADTADNAANEKDGTGAIEVKTDADIKNTRGTEPTLAPDKNASKTAGSIPWDVYLDGKLIDTVFYVERADGGAIQTAADVKQSLVGHDGYDPRIIVRRRIRSRAQSNEGPLPSEKHTGAGHKPGCECGFCKNKGSFGKKKEDEKDDDKKKKEASIDIASLEPVRTTTASEETVSDRAKEARNEHEKKLAKFRRTVVADESDDILSEVLEPMGAPAEVKEKDGDGRPDGATPKLADGAAMDWFITDRDPQGQPKENVPEALEIPESEPVTGVYKSDDEGKDPVGKALQSVTTDVKAPADMGESKATDVKEPLDLNEAAARWLRDESVEEHHEEAQPAEEHSEEQHTASSMTMTCPWCGAQAKKESHEAPFVCTKCDWRSQKVASLRPKYASDRVIATLDDLLAAEPFDPENEDHPDSSLMEGLVSGPIPGGRHETNDTAGPANKVADLEESGLQSDAEVIPKKTEPAKLDAVQLGGPQNSSERPNVDAVREQVETSQEMDKHETIAEKEAEVAAKAEEDAAPAEAAPEEEGMMEVVNAPAGSGKIVININAKWLKAHGIEADGSMETPAFFECGSCGGLHPLGAIRDAMGFHGEVDCRNDEYRLSLDVLDKYPNAQVISIEEQIEAEENGLEDPVLAFSKNYSLDSGDSGDKEAGRDEQVEPITSGMGGGGQGSTAGPVGAEGMPNLEASNEIAVTADSLAQTQADFFTNDIPGAVKSIMPTLPAAGGEAAELALAASKTAERALPRVTTPSEDYNGWHNWETWHIALLINNEELSQKVQTNLARRALKEAKGGAVNIDKLADQFSKMFTKAYNETKAFYESNAREFGGGWAEEPFNAVNWHEIAQNAVNNEEVNQKPIASDAPQVPPASAEKEASAKESGFNFFFPGQVLREFYPEVQHEIVDYPNADNKPMIQDVDLAPGKMGTVEKESYDAKDEDLPATMWPGGKAPEDKEGDARRAVRDEGLKQDLQKKFGADDNLTCKHCERKFDGLKQKMNHRCNPKDKKEAGSPDYVSTDPGAIGIGRDGKPQVLEGAPLRKENDIRGPMFSEEFYANYPGIPGAALKMQGSLAEFKKKAAASTDQKEMLSDFLKKVMGEIACTFVSAFKVTSRPVQLDKIPGTGEVNLVNVENSVNNWPFYAGEVGGRVKFLLEQMNDSDIQDAINDAWSQAAVWHSGSGSGNFTYEVFVRAETIDTDNLTLKYKFVTGTKGN